MSSRAYGIDKLVAALRAPAEDEGFMKWLSDGVYQGKRTSNVMTRLGKVAKDCIEPTLLRVMSNDFIEKLRRRMASLTPDGPPPEDEQSPPEAAGPGAVDPLETRKPRTVADVKVSVSGPRRGARGR